jgi:creatinine amidohydrolase/Fe(II)-dependent formamide hydrolase-like protein
LPEESIVSRTAAAALLNVTVLATLAAQHAAPFQTTRAAGQTQAAAPSRDIGGGRCADNKFNCPDTPNPLKTPDTVWIEEMTWMDVRDAMNAGKKTIIISTGGIEPNGPFLALGKHNYVLRANCDAIARKLGNALCAPIDPFVPEGPPDRKQSHMATMGTISLRQETFQALLTDIVTSFKTHGFENIILIGDSGGNSSRNNATRLTGMAAVAAALNTEWNANPVVAHVQEHYDYNSVDRLLRELGVTKEGQPSDGLHDDPGITLNMFVTDPKSVRYEERVKAGLATINGVSIADKNKNLEIGKKIVDMRATNTAAAIKKAIENKGKTQ